MATPNENLLPLGYLTGREQNSFTIHRECNIKKSVNRPMQLQTDVLMLKNYQHLRVMHLQQRLQELKERECMAQQHNRQLLQQFEEAQGILKQMMASNATMKTIRIEYERYLEESSHRWQQQIKEKTKAAQKSEKRLFVQQRMEDYLRPSQKNTEEQVTKLLAHRPLLTHGLPSKPQKTAAPQEHSDYNQEGSSHPPCTQPSWLTQTHSQSARFSRMSNQSHSSFQVPPSLIPPPVFSHLHPVPLHHLPSTPSNHKIWQDPMGWVSSQSDHPWSWAAGVAGIVPDSEALLGQLYMEEPPPESKVSQDGEEEEETRRAAKSKKERCGGSRSSNLSQELDIKPVRLFSSHAESSESGRDSSVVSKEKRKKREKRGRTEKEERHSSQESSRTSSAIVNASVTVAQSSGSDALSEKGHASSSCSSSKRRMSRGTGGLAAGLPRSQMVPKEMTRSKEEDSESPSEESQHAGEDLRSVSEESKSEKLEDQSPDDKSDSVQEGSGSQMEEEAGTNSLKIENGAASEVEKQDSSSAEESSAEETDEKENKKNLVAREDEDTKNHQQVEDDDDDREVKGGGADDDDSDRKNTTEEEVETGDEKEAQGEDEKQSNKLRNEDAENNRQSSASSQDEEVDEDESEGSEDSREEDEEESDEEEEGESEDEEEHRRDDAGESEEDRDSEDIIIISPQEKKPKHIQIISEEAIEGDDDERSKAESSNDDSNGFSDEDIENLLAPQENTEKQKEKKDVKADEKPKVTCDSVQIFQVQRDSLKTDHPSDSDEFDHFYD